MRCGVSCSFQCMYENLLQQRGTARYWKEHVEYVCAKKEYKDPYVYDLLLDKHPVVKTYKFHLSTLYIAPCWDLIDHIVGVYFGESFSNEGWREMINGGTLPSLKDRHWGLWKSVKSLISINMPQNTVLRTRHCVSKFHKKNAKMNLQDKAPKLEEWRD